MTTRLTIISGGLREPSSTRLLADRLEASVRTELAALDITAESSFVELRPLGRPIMDAMLTGLVAAPLESAFETVASADGVIAVANQLGGLQLDPTRTIERTELLVLWSRLGNYERPIVDQLLREIGLESGDIQRLAGGVSGATAALPPASPPSKQ